MVLEIKSISCIEGLKTVPELIGLEKESNWLNLAQYSLSTKSGTLAFAYGSSVAILCNQWDNRSQQYKYSIVWSGEVDAVDDEITAVLCLPILLNSNDCASADSSCVVLGYSSGTVQFLTSRGKPMLKQLWYAEPVQGISIQSERKAIEELYVVYKSCVCIVQSRQMLALLKNLIVKPQEFLSSITCRVWKYGDSNSKSEAITTSAIVGSKQIGLFEHLLAASTEGGFHAKYRSSAPQQLAVLSVGSSPFLGFHYARELVVHTTISNVVARAVANKVKNVLPSWFPGAQSSVAEANLSPPISTESMTLRYALYDDHRATSRVWLAPHNRLAAVADSLGRVILVDCVRNIIVRVWKGYRDAQCSFIQADEKLPKSAKDQKRKHALFLAIYSPRRSSVDIWNLERGKKLVVFPAGPNGQLIQQPSHSSIDSGTASNKSSNSAPCSAFFLNPSDFSLKELTIPFHYALDACGSRKTKDLHVVNQLKSLIKSYDESDAETFAEILELCNSIQTNEMRFKCANALAKNKHISPVIFTLVVTTFRKNIRNEIEDGDEDDDSNNVFYGNEQLLDFLSKYEKLVTFFVEMRSAREANSTEDDKAISISHFEDILKVIDTYKVCLNTKRTSKVTIQSPYQSNHFVEYLSIFDCTSKDGIVLNEARSNRFTAVGFDLFNSYIESNPACVGFMNLAADSLLSSKDLARLFLRYWMEKNIQYEDKTEVMRHLTTFSKILVQICGLDRESVEYKYNSLSAWWQEIREILLESPSVFKSLLAAMMCRDISIYYRQEEILENDDVELWEAVSQETAQWSLLIGKLDDIAVLSSILSQKPALKIESSDSSSQDFVHLTYNIPDISLINIVNAGKGIVSELVAKWVASTRLHPAVFFRNEQEATEECNWTSIAEYLNLLREHFPFSLRSGLMLCHLTWEYMNAFTEEVNHLEYFSAALECLSLFKESDLAIKHGICCIIWNQCIRKLNLAAIRLINSAGQSPDDTKSSIPYGFTDIMIPEFIVHCDNFIKHLIESETDSKPTIKYEELLQDTQPSLPQRAVQQESANSELIELHQQLNQVILLIASLNVNYKNTVQSLFNEHAQKNFASDINAKSTEIFSRIDEGVSKRRRQFVRRAITAAIDFIRQDSEEVYANDYEQWMESIVLLAKRWNLSMEDLFKYQVVQLYTRGWDDLAESKLQTMTDQSSMGKSLLLITGTRLYHYIKDKPDVYSQVVSTGTLISSYIEAFEATESGKSLDISIESSSFFDKLLKLARKTYECLAQQESPDLRLAAQIFDACSEIRD